MIQHGIQVDGLFNVLCRDKVGTYTAGAPGYTSMHPWDIVSAEIIAAHMATMGYRYVSQPPGLLLPGEMTIVRI